eukprot:20558-Heterococcus_DN1.PRE.1
MSDVLHRICFMCMVTIAVISVADTGTTAYCCYMKNGLTVAVPHPTDSGGTSTKARRRDSYSIDNEAATVAAASAAAVAAAAAGGGSTTRATGGATDDNNNTSNSNTNSTGGDSHTDRYRAAVRAELDPTQLSPTSRRRMIDRERKRVAREARRAYLDPSYKRRKSKYRSETSTDIRDDPYNEAQQHQPYQRQHRPYKPRNRRIQNSDEEDEFTCDVALNVARPLNHTHSQDSDYYEYDVEDLNDGYGGH